MIRYAEQSPRICKDGSLRWYEGDTFEIDFEMNFNDEEGNPIILKDSDKLTITFTDFYGNVIHTQEVIGINTLTLKMDNEATSKFKVGKYDYTIRVVGDFITTLARLNKVVVE